MTGIEESDTARLVRVETKLDLLVQQLMPLQVDHETRLRKLERAVYLAAGAGIAGGGAAGALFTQVLG